MFPTSFEAEQETPRSPRSEGFPLLGVGPVAGPARQRFDPIAFGLLAFAVVALGYLAYVWVDRITYQAEEEERFAAAMAAAAEHRAAARPMRADFADGSIGRLTISAADVSVLVGPSADGLSLRRGAGHIRGTAWPGEPGNVGIAGHRDDVFRGLRHVKVGDRISLETPRGLFEYRIESLRTVSPSRVDVLGASDYRTITLVTCYPFDFIGSAPLRFVVRARQIL